MVCISKSIDRNQNNLVSIEDLCKQKDRDRNDENFINNLDLFKSIIYELFEFYKK